jgi:transcriptional regulator with XRE-family HTH domain
MRENRAKTQAEVAEAVGVSRATIAQWEGSRFLPSTANAETLDGFLDAGGALRRLAEQERAGLDADRVSDTGTAGPTLLEVFRSVDASLQRTLQRGPDGTPLGWCQNLQAKNPPSPLSTAYGIQAALLIEEVHKSVLEPLAARLNDWSLGGGWAASSQSAPRPEAIAIVVDALVRVDPTSHIQERLERLEASIDGTTLQRPTLMAMVLETVLDLEPDSAFATKMVQSLLDCRVEHGPERRLLWPQKKEPMLAYPEPAVAQTARSVCALARAQGVSGMADELRDRIGTALAAAVEWLLRQNDLTNKNESVVRKVDGRSEVLPLRHFTAALVARACLMAGQPASHPAVREALRQTWRQYSAEHALWRWETGDLPIWMTFDGLAALRLAALATFIPET